MSGPRVPLADGDAQARVELIASAINDENVYWPVIDDLIAALELCLQSNTLTWEIEQEADVVVERARRTVGEKFGQSAGGGI